MQLRKVIKECLFSFHELKEAMIRGNEEKGDYLKKGGCKLNCVSKE